MMQERIGAAPSASFGKGAGRWPLCVALCVLGPAASADAANYTTIDLGGYIGTQVHSMNNKGVVTGIYGCGGSVIGSFIRGADGTITTFSALPCSGDKVEGTYANSINDKGVTTGTIWNYPDYAGFVRSPDGKIVSFACSGSNDTVPVSINDQGLITGTCSKKGFVRTPGGKTTTFSVSGATDTQPSGINDSGVIAGIYAEGSGQHGFLRGSDGTITTFDPPKSDETWVTGINGKGVITGYCKDTQSQIIGAFVRTADGTFSVLTVHGHQTDAQAISDRGAIVGYYAEDNFFHGFMRSPDGRKRSFDPPNSGGTFPVAIDSNGAIAGTYWDSGCQPSGTCGFLRTR